jgi:hypothetical protein
MTAGLVFFTSCKRNKTDTSTATLTNADDNGGYASDAAKLDRNSNDAMSIADAAAATGGANLRTTAVYPLVTNDTTVVPHVLTIDFGPTDHTCLDGRVRKGMIIVTYTGHYKDSASTHTISYSGYYVDDVQLKGYKTVTNMGTNGLGQYWYSVNVHDSLVFSPDTIVSWVGTRTRTWIAGYSTSDRSDDEYTIGGTTTLTRANGHVFTHTISTADPLHIKQSCPYIESGTVTISSTSFSGGDRTLDYGYGGGGCDNKALLTIGTHTYVITIR